MATGSNRNYERGGIGETGEVQLGIVKAPGKRVLAVLFRNKVHGEWRVVVVWRIEKRRLANSVPVLLLGTAGSPA